MIINNPKITFVSSMNKKLYEEYGKRFLEEFNQCAGENIKLLNIFEGLEIIHNNSDKIKNIIFQDESHKKFKKFFGNLYEANGIKMNIFNQNGEQRVSFQTNFRYNAIKFSFKVFSIKYSLNFLESEDYLIWTDADLRCKKNFSSNDLIEFLPEKDQVMSYLGRTHFPPGRPYSECGFLGFNLKHKEFKQFINRMVEVYSSGEIFSYVEWHDSWIWDQIRLEFEEKNINFKNISGPIFEKLEHPFVNCNLGKFFDHLKGNRKNTGSSHKEDYK